LKWLADLAPNTERYRFRANEARLQLSLLAYNLGNLWRRLVLPKRIDDWSLTSLQQRLVKNGWAAGQACPLLLDAACRGQLRRRLFGQMLQRIYALSLAERLALRFAVAKSGTEGEGLSSV